jgi:glutamate-ammonia-ligase adenylyltransferase
MRRRELGRLAVTDVLGRLPIEQAAEALTDLTFATLSVPWRLPSQRWRRSTALLADSHGCRRDGSARRARDGYASDADVLFVHLPHEDADEKQATRLASAVAQRLRQMLGQAGEGPALDVDADLRPEGKQGPLVRSLSSYAAYYRRWVQVWEKQALLRADAAVGDLQVREQFEELINPIRWPAAGLDPAAVTEIRRLKARVDAERLPRGADPSTHLKLGAEDSRTWSGPPSCFSCATRTRSRACGRRKRCPLLPQPRRPAYWQPAMRKP